MATIAGLHTACGGLPTCVRWCCLTHVASQPDGLDVLVRALEVISESPDALLPQDRQTGGPARELLAAMKAVLQRHGRLPKIDQVALDLSAALEHHVALGPHPARPGRTARQVAIERSGYVLAKFGFNVSQERLFDIASRYDSRTFRSGAVRWLMQNLAPSESWSATRLRGLDVDPAEEPPGFAATERLVDLAAKLANEYDCNATYSEAAGWKPPLRHLTMEMSADRRITVRIGAVIGEGDQPETTSKGAINLLRHAVPRPSPSPASDDRPDSLTGQDPVSFRGS